MSSGKYYKNIDLIRLLACLAVLLYHLNILKGGYLAVCVFFVLSGYLSCVSAFKKEKFSLLSYYWNRFLKIYLPLIICVFLTIGVTSFFSDINWFNLKPETTSVLLGYNNFWQLSANLDYFARHINSPFIHLWYISILLQFDLIFPFIYLLLRKIGDKINKIIPCIITIVLSIIFMVFFYYMSISNSMMEVYYNTFTRIFSLFCGVALGFIHSYYKPVTNKFFTKEFTNKIIFTFYCLILILLFVFVEAQSKFFFIGMLLSTIISCRLIDYAVVNEKNRLNVFDKVVKFISGMSYEIYLVQYPIIFLLQYIIVPKYLYFPIIIISIFLISFLLHFAFNKSNRLKFLKFLLMVIIYIMCLYGLIQYSISKDHTAEMKLLEEQLAKNQEIAEAKREEYQLQLKQESDDLAETLLELENGEQELGNKIANLSLVGIGDSVMLGAIGDLYKQFPNGYFDAAISRTAWVAADILRDLKNKNILGNPIVLNLGANGDCSDSCKSTIIKEIGNRKIFWINVTNDKDVHVNDSIAALSLKYDNVYIIDWNEVSKNHPEYFISDGIHLTDQGKKVYVKTIYDTIYNVYYDEYKNKKQEIIKEHDEKTKNRISFVGNGILLNAFDKLHANFSDANFIVNQSFDYETLKGEIVYAKEHNKLTNKIVLAFDNSMNISFEEYQELISICGDRNIYILSMNANVVDNNLDNVHIIDFYKETQINSNYLMVDKIHLTEEGNQALINMFNNVFLTNKKSE